MDLRELPRKSFRRHPWETVRAKFFKKILESCDHSQVSTVLDVGAGDGWLTEQLLDELPGASAVCWDKNYRMEDLVSTPERLDLTATRPDKKFDAIFLLDILEHIEDDHSFLKELIESQANPEALVLVSVPAWERLYCSHDTVFTHHRRYNPDTLRNLLHSSGLTILREGGLFHGLIFPRILNVAKEKMFGPTTETPKPLHWRHGEVSAQLLEGILTIETHLSHLASKIDLPVPGLSQWALCRKTKTTE